MVALVTGASSGIGRDIARELAKRKYNLIIVARDKEKLKQVKENLENEFNIVVDYYSIDLANKDKCVNLYETIKDKYTNIDVLVNNAGFGACGEFTKIDLEKEIQMINTNIVAVHILTKLFLQDMIKKNEGYIMNVASIAGFMPGPLMATYYSTKSYIVRLTQSIQRELKMQKSKVKVSILCPGPVKTNFQKVADVKFNMPETSSEKVAKVAVNKMLKGKRVIFTQLHIALARIIAKILPDSFMALCCYYVQRRKLYNK